MMLATKQRFLGCLSGLAVGDAVGTTLEFRRPGSFEPITDMIGGGPFHLQAGQWTDDTSMALCLAHSLLEQKGFDATDQMQRYLAWKNNGYMSSTGRCFDIGMTVSEALQQFQQSGDPFSGSAHPMAAGNGSLMRLAPVVLYFYPEFEAVLYFAGESSRTTHAALECIDACRYFASVLYLALQGADKDSVLSASTYTPQTAKVKAISSGDYRNKSRDKIRGTGYVIDSLEASLWCFARTDNFRDAILMAANLGDDADTTAAICGQLAGTYYGIDGIPADWLQKLVMRDHLQDLALALLHA